MDTDSKQINPVSHSQGKQIEEQVKKKILSCKELWTLVYGVRYHENLLLTRCFKGKSKPDCISTETDNLMEYDVSSNYRILVNGTSILLRAIGKRAKNDILQCFTHMG